MLFGHALGGADADGGGEGPVGGAHRGLVLHESADGPGHALARGGGCGGVGDGAHAGAGQVGGRRELGGAQAVGQAAQDEGVPLLPQGGQSALEVLLLLGEVVQPGQGAAGLRGGGVGRDGGDGRDGEGTFGSHGKTIALVAVRWQATTCPALRSSARDGQFDA